MEHRFRTIGHWLATAAGRKLRIWDIQGRLVRDDPDHPSTIADLKWKPRSPLLAPEAYGRLAIWSPADAEPRRTFEWNGSMLALAWNPDGHHIATGDQDVTVHYSVAN